MTAPTGQKFVQSKTFLRALHEAGLLPEYPYVSRVVIDADVRDGGGIVRMYIDAIPHDALLSIAPLMTEAT